MAGSTHPVHPSHPAILSILSGPAITIANLARVLKDAGQLAEAEELFRRALAITERGGAWDPKYLIYLRGSIGGVVVLRHSASSGGGKQRRTSATSVIGQPR